MLTKEMLVTFFLENAQIGILILGTIGIFMMSIKSRWGIVVGLIAQPFWWISTYSKGEWGMFYNSVGYTISLLIGIAIWFFPKKQFVVIIEVSGARVLARVEGRSFEEVVGKTKVYLGERGNVIVTPLENFTEMSAKQFTEKLGYLKKVINT